MHYVALVVIVIVGSYGCPDRWALSSVDVWAHRNVKGSGEHFTNISLNNVDNYQMVEVIKANASVLCEGMVKNFPRLLYLTFIEANISQISPGTFQELPNLLHLSLAVNHLTSIERYQFQNLNTLAVLYLSSNEIENIDENAFDDLTQLKKIFLDRNKIMEINGNWFLKLKQISVISLAFNKITRVQTNAFTLPKNSRVEIRLQHNEIEQIDPSAVIGLGNYNEIPYLSLKLDHNNISDITVEFLNSMDKLQSNLLFNYNTISCLQTETIRSLKNVTISLSLLSNPLDCDCLNTISNFQKDHVLRANIFYSSSLECKLDEVQPLNDWRLVI